MKQTTTNGVLFTSAIVLAVALFVGSLIELDGVKPIYCTSSIVTGVDTIPAYVTHTGNITTIHREQIDTLRYCNRWVDADGREVDEDGQLVAPFVSHKARLKVEK